MDRSFIVITAAASALMFAGVWTATAPGGAPPPALVSPADAVPAADPPKPEERPRIMIAGPARDTAPYNVRRMAYGEAAAPPPQAGPAGFMYRGCREARAAGATPLHRGSPGYGEHMDGDGDGIACEDY